MERNFFIRVVIGTKAETRSLMIKSTGGGGCFKCGKEGCPVSHFTEENNKYGRKKYHTRSDDKKSRAH